MSPYAKQLRHHQLIRYVTKYSSSRWAWRLMEDLNIASEKSASSTLLRLNEEEV